MKMWCCLSNKFWVIICHMILFVINVISLIKCFPLTDNQYGTQIIKIDVGLIAQFTPYIYASIYGAATISHMTGFFGAISGSLVVIKISMFVYLTAFIGTIALNLVAGTLPLAALVMYLGLQLVLLAILVYFSRMLIKQDKQGTQKELPK